MNINLSVWFMLKQIVEEWDAFGTFDIKYQSTYIDIYISLPFTTGQNSQGEQTPCRLSVGSPGNLGTPRELWSFTGDSC